MSLHQQEKREKLKTSAPAVLLVAMVSTILFILAAPSTAANWHEGDKGFCGDCHDTHIENRGMGLFKAGSGVKRLCLNCHGGGKSGAPNVFAGGKAAGFFEGYKTVSRNGHDLGVVSGKVGPSIYIDLECTTCHDPHGNDNYRNLRPDPSNPRASGVKISAGEKPKSVGKKYEEVQYIKGISAWCQKCHTDLYLERPDKRPHHKVGVRLKNLKQKVRLKRPVTIILPMDDPMGNTKPDDPASQEDDTINCITCHFAHGSDNPYALRYVDGKQLESTCKSCHITGVKDREPPAVKRPKKPATKPKKFRYRAR